MQRCVAVMLRGHTLQNDKLAKKNKNSLGTKLVPYSGKHLREKTFANFMVLCLFAKVFSAKFGCVASFGKESFLHKNRIFHHFAKVFSFKSFPLYGILPVAM